MLSPMRLVEQWRAIENELPEGWAEARLALEVEDAARTGRAAQALAPLTPGRAGDRLRFSAVRGGHAGPEHVRRVLGRLDREGIRSTLTLVDTRERETVAAPAAPSVAVGWDEAVRSLPDDWSDLLCELELRSTDQLDRAALLLSPVNPARPGTRPTLRFRVARRFGYGASPGMVRRCLARLDEDGIAGRVTIVRALSDSRPVATQGPVWYIGGRAV